MQIIKRVLLSIILVSFLFSCFTFADAETTAKMFRRAMYWAKIRYNENVGLIKNPQEGPDVHHWPRETVSYAVGLLKRNMDSQSDKVRAIQMLNRVLALQYLRKGHLEYGSFPRYWEDPLPPNYPTSGKDFDPNWRQFIGTSLAVILEDFSDLLPDELKRRIEFALIQAVEGEELQARLNPNYTNIALLHAFIQNWVGAKFNRPDWEAKGEAFGQKVADTFFATGAFPEFNSPTYYGYDFYALALWRARAPSKKLREWGTKIEHDLWLDTANFYNPSLKNLAGPFGRAYAMDMTSYVSIVGLILFGELGVQIAPFPMSDDSLKQGLDYMAGPLLMSTPTIIPPEVLTEFETFTEPRLIKRQITVNPNRTATAWIEENLMIGAEFTDFTRGAGETNEQYVPVTLQWRLPSGRIGWIRLKKSGNLNAVAFKRVLEVESRLGDFIFEAFVPGASTDSFSQIGWNLPGLSVKIESNSTDFQAVPTGAGLWELEYSKLTRFRLDVQ